MRKNLLVLGMSVATVVAVSFFAFQKNGEQTYVPRSESNSAQGIKGAFEYYNMMRADLETGEVNQELILQKKAEITSQITSQLNSMGKSGSSAMDWIEMGPNNVGGRTRTIIALKNNPNTMYAGSITGGLWKSTDGAQTWSIVTSFTQNLAVSSIAELGNGWIVVGTGCTFESANGFGGSGSLGDGLFVSKDNGATFSIVKDDSDNNVEYSKGWREFNKLIADPNNPSVVWAATSKGVRKINLTTGELILPSGASAATCYDIALSSTGSMIIASYSSSIYQSKDSGNSFVKISGSGTGKVKDPAGRATLAISQDNPAYMYALMATGSGTFDALYFSVDSGNTWAVNWTNPSQDPFVSANGQGFYDQVITVIPGKPGVVLVAGVTLWIAGPNHQPEQAALNFASPFSPYYVHSDIHHLSWLDNNKLLIGCDGGIHIGTYDGATFTFGIRNNGYNVTQFYSIGIDGDGKVIGGTQDNGTQYVKFEGQNPQAAVRVIGGDGFTCDLSTLLPGGAIGSVYNGDFQRSLNINTSGFSGFVSDISTGDFGGFYTLGALYENDYDWKATGVSYTYTNPDTRDALLPGEIVTVASEVLTGQEFKHALKDTLGPEKSVSFFDKTNVMYAVDQGSAIYLTREVWNFQTVPEFWKIADNQSGINQMAFSHDGDHLFLAKLGGVARISGLRDAWDEATADVEGSEYALTVSNIIGGGLNSVSDVAVDRSDADHVVAVRYGYNAGVHVFESFNATEPGASFTSIQGDLPDIPVYAVEIDYSDPNIIYLGTEEGIYVTEDGGETWINQVVNGVERTPVFDLRIQNTYSGRINNTGVVYAGTHGRGFFKMENRLVEFDSLSIGIKEVDLTLNTNLKVFPNPVVDNATVAFDLNKNERASLSVMNLSGQIVKTINAGNLSVTNENLVEFNVAELPVGTYLVHLNNGSDQRTARFIKTN